jgi:hypothetical protein
MLLHQAAGITFLCSILDQVVFNTRLNKLVINNEAELVYGRGGGVSPMRY